MRGAADGRRRGRDKVPPTGAGGAPSTAGLLQRGNLPLSTEVGPPHGAAGTKAVADWAAMATAGGSEGAGETAQAYHVMTSESQPPENNKAGGRAEEKKPAEKSGWGEGR